MSDDRKEEEIGESGEIAIKVPSGSSSKKDEKKRKKKRDTKADEEEVRFF